MPDRCVVNHRPYVLPMLRLVDEGKRYCIVVADKARARVFTMYQGEISERTEILDVVPGWHKQGGFAQARFQRHIKDAANKHLKHVADTVFEFYKGEGFGHLAIEVDDVYRACEAIRGRGGKIIREAGPMNAGSTIIAFVEDPDGYQIELLGPKQ